MVSRQFCSAPGPKRASLNDSTNASDADRLPLTNTTHRDDHSPKTLTAARRPATDNNNNANNGDNKNNRRLSLATRAGALVRQISSRANLTSETQPLRGNETTTTTSRSPPSAKMALFHTRTAAVHVENGEWSLALKSHNRALIHHRQLHGQDSAQCANTLNGIGVCLMNLATGGPRSLDEENPLCRDYVRYAECALREALYIREQIFGADSDEVEEVEINMELLLGSGWNDHDDDDATSKVDRSRPAASRSRGSSNPPSRCSSTDSLSGNNFQRAARRLFGGGTGSTSTTNAKTLRQSQNQMCGNDTASSSSSSSSSLSGQEEQIDFQYPSSFVDVDISAKDQSIASTPSTTAASSPSSSSWQPCSSPSNRSQTSSSSHSTASFGNEGDDDDDDDGIDGMGIGEIDLWALDDGSGDEIEEHRHRSSSTPLRRRSSGRSKGREAGRPSPTRACSVLFSSIN